MPSAATSEPSTITAGDSLAWTVALSDYLPTDGWMLGYALSGPSSQSVNTTASGAGFGVAVAPAETATWTPGSYLLTAFVSRGSGAERVTLYSRALQVQPDPTTAAAKTHAQRSLELIEAALEGRIPRGLENTTIDGQQIDRIPIVQLHALRDKYRREVQAEFAAARAAAGAPRRSQILIRFRRPGGSSHGFR